MGAGNGKGAKFATIVSVVESSIIGFFFWILIMLFHNELALIFTNSKAVLDAVNSLSLLLAFTILLNSVQPILSGNYSWKLINLPFVFIIWSISRFNELLNCDHIGCKYLTQKTIIGVAVGSGWQQYVAYINLGCYYLVGVPLGAIMGWVFHQGVMVSVQKFWLKTETKILFANFSKIINEKHKKL